MKKCLIILLCLFMSACTVQPQESVVPDEPVENKQEEIEHQNIINDYELRIRKYQEEIYDLQNRLCTLDPINCHY